MTQKILSIAIIVLALLVASVYIYPRFLQPEIPAEFTDVIITIERTPCFGACPTYNMTIFGDGRVVYEGTRFVNVTGIRTSQLSNAQVRQLVDEFYKAGYFALKDKYEAQITDLPTTITSITINGTKKQVINYYGAPDRLEQLENKIDEIVGSSKWIEGTEFDCKKLDEITCLEHQDVCEICPRTMVQSYASCHSKEFCANIPFE